MRGKAREMLSDQLSTGTAVTAVAVTDIAFPSKDDRFPVTFAASYKSVPPANARSRTLQKVETVRFQRNASSVGRKWRPGAGDLREWDASTGPARTWKIPLRRK
ncbi:hypothetical protein GCM10022284_70790 [Streptomyces hundungensis]